MMTVKRSMWLCFMFKIKDGNGAPLRAAALVY